jgi:hypothetical protein
MAKIYQLIENMASNVNGMSANENISAMKIIWLMKAISM